MWIRQAVSYMDRFCLIRYNNLNELLSFRSFNLLKNLKKNSWHRNGWFAVVYILLYGIHYSQPLKTTDYPPSTVHWVREEPQHSKCHYFWNNSEAFNSRRELWDNSSYTFINLLWLLFRDTSLRCLWKRATAF